MGRTWHVLRTPLAASLMTCKQTIQKHTKFLYVVRWSTALVILRTQHIQFDGMSAFQQADFALVVTTTVLSVLLLSSALTLATASRAYADPTRESHSGIVGVGSLITGRWYSNQIKTQDVPILSSVDAAASNEWAVYQVRCDFSPLFRIAQQLMQ